MPPESAGELVSVVIPIHNQAQYLAAAVQSVLAQTHAEREVVVVDDGSSDDPATVVAGFPEVRILRQENRGTAAARNRGLAESRGRFLVFLDADDRLLPHALERSLEALRNRPDYAFVFGRARRIRDDGSALSEVQPPARNEDLYTQFLRRCPVWHPAAAMFRRFVFDEGITFDPAMRLCGDYLLYLTAAARWPASCHDDVVSEYRRHASNKSGNSAEMMRYLLKALRSQRPAVRGSARLRAALREGVANCRRDYYVPAVQQAWRLWKSGRDRARARRDGRLLLGVTPLVLPRLLAGRAYRWSREVWNRRASVSRDRS